jgi:hypothetical protein
LVASRIEKLSALGAYLEGSSGAKEAHVELGEEVQLAQQQRHVVGVGPGEGKLNGRELADVGREYDAAHVEGGKIAGETGHHWLRFPVGAKLDASRVGQHVYVRPRVE